MEKTNVLVVDDSALYRRIISDLIKKDLNFNVITAPNGEIALKKIKAMKNIDIITSDINMPVMNGLELLQEILKIEPKMPVIMISSQNDSRTTVEALEIGAKDFIIKPDKSTDLHTMQDDLLTKLRIFTKKKIVKYEQKEEPRKEIRPPRRSTSPEERTVERKKNREQIIKSLAEEKEREESIFREKVKSIENRPIRVTPDKEVVCIGISTGGPNVLRKMVSKLKANYPLPILIVQHMPAGFTKVFADGLNKTTDNTVVEAKEGDVILPGHIYIAPGGFHMSIKTRGGKKIITINKNAPESGHRPSANVLYRAARQNYDPSKVLGIVMTGMGDDGSKELKVLRDAGAQTIAQNEESSTVFGMPRVAIKVDAAEFIGTPDKILAVLNSL